MKDAFPRFNAFIMRCKADIVGKARYTQPQSFGFPPTEAFHDISRETVHDRKQSFNS